MPSVEELMERAEGFGLHLEFDSGLVLVKCSPIGDPNTQAEIVKELGRNIVQVRRLAEQRAIGVRAKEFLRQRVWFPDFGEGTLFDANTDGSLTVAIERHGSRSSNTVSARAENVLIVMDDSTVVADEERATKASRKRILGMF